MPEFFENNEMEERVILVGVSSQDGDDTEDSLDELEELVKTAGAVTVGRVIQNRQTIHPGLYIGSGKVEELLDEIAWTNATGIVCDDELSPAQLRYRMSRLSGIGKSMSRLGGGIGTRGPGEKKLEVDRRLIASRISQLKRELEEVKRHREVNRVARQRNHVPVAAIVGYTNAGKSTLLNALTGAGILAEDKLFATLDPTTRMLELPGSQKLLLTDTVGFIRKLPHHLIDAFRSTLEEAKYADFIIHVVDASNPQAAKQMHIVYETLHQLEVTDKKILTLFNKQDAITDREPLRDGRADITLRVSAARGDGLEELKDCLARILRENKHYLETVLPYDKGGLLQQIRETGELIAEEYLPEGIRIEAYVPPELFEKIHA